MFKFLRIIECLILSLFFGLPPLIFCLVGTVLIAGIFLGTEVLGPWVLWSLVPGVILDAVFLKKWVKNAYQMNTKTLAVIYLFHSVLAAGLGMGIPLLNFALCIAAGLYIARKMHLAQADGQTVRFAFKKTALFCAAAMLMVCCLIVFWGAIGGLIGSPFETPWLSFTFTVPVFCAVALTASAALVLLQYGLTGITAKVTYRLHRLRAGPKIGATAAALVAVVAVAALAWHALDVYHTHRRNATAKRPEKAAQPSKQTSVNSNPTIK